MTAEGTLDYNPHLASQNEDGSDANHAAGKGKIEKPDEVENIINQTRSASPTEQENKLGDALTEIFDADIDQLSDVVAKLNDMGVTDFEGVAWTEESFQVEMKRLGA